MAWRRREFAQFCEEPAPPAGPREIATPDSAAAVGVARRALGELAEAGWRVTGYTPGGAGVLVQFADPRPNVLDGTATVYVTPGPCVALLGW